MSKYLEIAVKEHGSAISGFFKTHKKDLEMLAKRISTRFKNDKKLLLCGNGGSACDALHIAGEFVGRFVSDRKALPAIALTADSGILTAIGNDYGFEKIFSRQIEALGKKGDVLIAISTSGSSPNILEALKAAKKQGLYTVLLTGEKGKKNKDKANLTLAVPSLSTARIQETHITALQILVGLVEEGLFKK